MSEEEFFNRMINQISKVFDGRIATKMKNIYLKKDKQLNKQKEVLDKIKEYLEITKLIYDDDTCVMLSETWYGKEISKMIEEIN